MCPELDILSTYYDDEIEASLKTEIKKHVDSCPACQEQLARFHKISDMLSSEEEPDFDAAQTLVWDRIMDAVDEESSVSEPIRAAGFWQRKIQLSVPAAAAIAAAFIAAFSVGMYSFLSRSAVPSTMNPEISITDASGVVDDDSSLFNDKAIEFNIPVANKYINAGEPLLIREVDFRSRNGRY